MLAGVGAEPRALGEGAVWPRGAFWGLALAESRLSPSQALQPEQRLRGAVPVGRGRALGLPGVAEPVVSELCCSVWIAFEGSSGPKSLLRLESP